MEERRKAAELDKRTLEEQLCEKLRMVTKEIHAQIEQVGFKPIERYRHMEGSNYCNSYAVGPDNKVYRITAYSKGGYDIENIND